MRNDNDNKHHINDVTHGPRTSRRNFLRGTLFSFAAPSLLLPPLARQGLGFLTGDTGEVTSLSHKKDPSKGLIRKETTPGFFDKKLSFYNIHTGESLKNVVFWEKNAYVPDGLKALNKLFRDHRSGDITKIDLNLLDLLHKIQQKLETQEAFHLISGYRSPKTNDMLHKNSCGVAKQSQHCVGKAADIALPKTRSLRDIQRAAKALQLGGVGIYSQFVHVDTGRVRYW